MTMHMAQRDTIDNAGMRTEADDASRELAHDDEYPVVVHMNRIHNETGQCPKGWSWCARVWSVMRVRRHRNQAGNVQRGHA
jgi:hypothetical protein